MSGSLSHAPADIIRNLLIDLGLGTLPSDGGDWPVFAHREPSTPDSTITIYSIGGRLQGRSQNDGQVMERSGFQVRVRDANPTDGSEKARAISIALDETVYENTVTIGANQYLVHAVSRRSGPIALGKTADTKRNLFTINADAYLRQTV